MSIWSARAAAQKVGEHGLIALDWWNGNRSTLVDVDLTGMLLGMNLATRAPDVYRALIEATAFGTREIIEAFEARGIEVKELVAAGGLPEKNALPQANIRGCHRAGISSCRDRRRRRLWARRCTLPSPPASTRISKPPPKKMGKLKDEVVKPIPENQAMYDKLYEEYRTLYDYFGRGTNDVMKRLKSIKHEALG